MNLYNFQIELMEQTNRIDDRYGNTIGFLDNDLSHYNKEQIFEKMHDAYRKGLECGIKKEKERLKTLLGI